MNETFRDIRKALRESVKKQRKVKPPSVDLMVERQAAGLDLWTGLPLPNKGGSTNGRQTQTEGEN